MIEMWISAYTPVACVFSISASRVREIIATIKYSHGRVPLNWEWFSLPCRLRKLTCCASGFFRRCRWITIGVAGSSARRDIFRQFPVHGRYKKISRCDKIDLAFDLFLPLTVGLKLSSRQILSSGTILIRWPSGSGRDLNSNYDKFFRISHGKGPQSFARASKVITFLYRSIHSRSLSHLIIGRVVKQIETSLSTFISHILQVRCKSFDSLALSELDQGTFSLKSNQNIFLRLPASTIDLCPCKSIKLPDDGNKNLAQKFISASGKGGGLIKIRCRSDEAVSDDGKQRREVWGKLFLRLLSRERRALEGNHREAPRKKVQLLPSQNCHKF